MRKDNELGRSLRPDTNIGDERIWTRARMNQEEFDKGSDMTRRDTWKDDTLDHIRRNSLGVYRTKDEGSDMTRLADIGFAAWSVVVFIVGFALGAWVF